MRRRSVWVIVVSAGVVAVAAIGVAALAQTKSSQPTLTAILGVLRRPQTEADLSLGRLRSYAMFADRSDGRRPVRGLIRLAATAPGGFKVFLIAMRPAGRGNSNAKLTLALLGGCCVTAAAIEADGTWMSSGPPERLVVVVPDGVTKVGGLILRRPTFKQSDAVTAPVRNNVAVFALRRPIESPGGFVWYGRSGHVIKRVG
jgi:hypothetical protein